jgi:hypothetical protein
VRRALLAALIAAASLIATATASADYSVTYSNGAGCGIYTASGSLSYFNTTVCNGTPMGFGTAATSTPRGTSAFIEARAPAGLTITQAQVSPAALINENDGHQWGGGSFYNGGGTTWATGDNSELDAGFSSSYWGFQIVCGASPCNNSGAVLSVNSIRLTVHEAQGPALVAQGANNLFYQTGHYVWNPVGDGWPITVSGSDPSGVCALYALVNGAQITGPAQPHDGTTWHQCPDWTWPASVDTRDYVSTSGPLSLTLAGTNAAGVTSAPSQTLEVDNDPVSVSLATPDDANPSVWVDHAVTVQAAASAGPSGIAGTNCSVDSGASTAYPSGGFTLDGDGAHTVSCTASNNAIDPQGAPNTGSASEVVKIDEAPPSVGFEAVNPSDPTALIADTSDAESGVAGGSITVTGPHASTPTALPTSFDGSHLISRFDDAGKNGDYTFTATSCDAVGNCAASAETLHFPIRLGSRSAVSFAQIQTPAKIVHKRVRVGYHYKRVTRKRHGRRVKVRIRVGGHLKRIKLVIPVNQACANKRVRVSRRRWREVKACRVMKIRTVTKRRARYGKKITVHGLLISAQGAPLANVPVTLLTRPDDRGGRFRPVTSTTTNASGIWAAKLPRGPSRIIHAYYPGSPTIEPATGTAVLSVPAKIALTITPHILPWNHSIRIRGHLVGRYVPADGVALRLLVRYPGATQSTPLQALRTNRRGQFDFTWSYHAGRGIAAYPFSVATTATESDYPFAASVSRAVRVTFGRATPAAAVVRHRHRAKKRRKKARPRHATKHRHKATPKKKAKPHKKRRGKHHKKKQ